VLEGRCHAVDLALGQAVARGFVAPRRDGLAHFLRNGTRLGGVEVEVSGIVTLTVESGFADLPVVFNPKDVVLLDNVRQQRKRRRCFEDFAPVDHEAVSFLADGNQRRHAVTSFSGGSVGSSRA